VVCDRTSCTRPVLGDGLLEGMQTDRKSVLKNSWLQTMVVELLVFPGLKASTTLFGSASSPPPSEASRTTSPNNRHAALSRSF
jgi:hypothetical protein